MKTIMKIKWDYDKKANDFVAENKGNSSLTGLTDTQLKILYNRDINTPEKIYDFLYSGLGDLIDTRKMKDASKASEIIRRHIKEGNKIVIHTDYDSDGAHAGAVGMILGKKIGADIECYSNNRFTQGYGLKPSSVQEIMEKYPTTKLLITADNGIVAVEGVEEALKYGLEVIITDHHEPKENKTPRAHAIVDPKQTDDNYPFKGLCGAGVLFKLFMLIYFEMGRNVEETYEVLDLVAMATVGDIVPLISENRILVKEGLKMIREEKRKVFKYFREINKVSVINTHFTLGFIYIPQINSVGRLDGNIAKVIDLYLSEDDKEIIEILNYIKDLNEKRKEMTKIGTDKADELIQAKYEEIPSVLIIANDNLHEGIIGLIAGRLKEKYNRPTFIFTNSENGDLKASGRSIAGLHIKEMLDSIESLTTGYGGHAMACGVSVKPEIFEENVQREASKVLNEKHFTKHLNIDDYFKPQEIKIENIDEINELEPYGEAFKIPLFGIKTNVYKLPRLIGADKTHAKIQAENDFDILLWRYGVELTEKVYKKKKITPNYDGFILKALGMPGLNTFNGVTKVQFTIDNNHYKIY